VEEDSDSQVSALILDTDIVVWVLRERPPAVRFVHSIPSGRRNLSAVTYSELLFRVIPGLELEIFRP
jgi:hypothetical protein